MERHRKAAGCRGGSGGLRVRCAGGAWRRIGARRRGSQRGCHLRRQPRQQRDAQPLAAQAHAGGAALRSIRHLRLQPQQSAPLVRPGSGSAPLARQHVCVPCRQPRRAHSNLAQARCSAQAACQNVGGAADVGERAEQQRRIGLERAVQRGLQADEAGGGGEEGAAAGRGGGWGGGGGGGGGHGGWSLRRGSSEASELLY